MHESSAEIQTLQELLDRSYEKAGPHLRRIFRPENRLTAEELISKLPGIFEIHLATTTPSGAPFVAPIDAQLFKVQIWFSIPGSAIRAPFFRRDPRVSASFTRESFALIVHGSAIEADESDPVVKEYQQYVQDEYAKLYGPGWREGRDRQRQREKPGQDYTGRIEARRMFAKR